ncbi:MAG: hypothetical protein D6685_19690 [Bacteroidetes bacterium]|nr:MAG: hypothetical protein D6685_19690 [Bacteroidota bacterium]
MQAVQDTGSAGEVRGRTSGRAPRGARRTSPRRCAVQPASLFMRIVLGMLVGVMAVAGSARAQTAWEILERTAARYLALEQYHFAGTTAVQMQAGGRTETMDLRMQVARSRAGGMRVEVDGPTMQMTYVTDGRTSWMYQPAQRRYVRRPGGASRQEAPDLLQSYTRLASGVEDAAILRMDTLRVGAETVPAYVVAVTYSPQRLPAGTDSLRTTLWIDATRFIVLREERREHQATSPAGGPMTVAQTTVYTTASTEAPPDSLFVFHPPDGVQEVSPQVFFGSGSPDLTGRPAPGFRLPGLSGHPVALSDLKGQVVLINFWATWCGPCQVEMPVLEQLHREFGDDGLVILAINLMEPFDEARAYVQRFGYTFPVLLDIDGAVAQRYRVESVPTSLLIDREGTVVRHLVGMHPEADFRRALQALGFGE